MMLRATLRTAAVSTWGSMAVFLASAAIAWRMRGAAQLVRVGLAGTEPQSRWPGCVHADVTEAGSWPASAPAMASSWSSSWRGSLTSMPVAVAVIEFSHVTKACASVPQIPVAGCSASGIARAVGPGRLGVGQEEPVQVGGDGPGADPGPGGGGEGLAR